MCTLSLAYFYVNYSATTKYEHISIIYIKFIINFKAVNVSKMYACHFWRYTLYNIVLCCANTFFLYCICTYPRLCMCVHKYYVHMNYFIALLYMYCFKKFSCY